MEPGEHAPNPKRWIRRCPRCGKELPADQRLCPDDGAALSEPSLLEPTAIGRAVSEEEEETNRGTGSWEATVKRDILIGTRVGEYVVQRRIGSGGMGIVYEAEQPQIGRKVAVKILRPDVRSRQDASLAGEARASGRIRHRAIVDVFGYGEIPAIGQYLVMEYLEGRPLDLLLADRGPLTASEVLWLLDEVLSGLGAAHAEGVIHRDLKPSNLFVVSASGGSQYVKILDFGLAKQTERRDPGAPSSGQGLLLGTPEYMAPEMAQGNPVSGRTDLYSLGVIAFEMLTGQRPFAGETPLQTAIAHVQRPPPRPSELAPVPRELDALVLRMLEKDPARRPADAASLRREVKELAHRLGAVTKIGKKPEPVARQVEEPTLVHRGAPEAPPSMTSTAMMIASLRQRRWPWVALAVAGLAGGVVWVRSGPPEPVAKEPARPATATREPLPQTNALATPRDPPPGSACALAREDPSARRDAPGPSSAPEAPPRAVPTARGTPLPSSPESASGSARAEVSPGAPARAALPASPESAPGPAGVAGAEVSPGAPAHAPTATETPPRPAPVLTREVPHATPAHRSPPARAPAEPTQEDLLKRIEALRRRVEASAPPGGSPNPMMLTVLNRQDAAARAAPGGPARAKVARTLDAFEQQFEKSGDLKPR